MAYNSGDALLRNPISGIAVCWASAASGHAAAQPAITLMNARRLIAAPQGLVAIVPTQSGVPEGLARGAADVRYGSKADIA